MTAAGCVATFGVAWWAQRLVSDPQLVLTIAVSTLLLPALFLSPAPWGPAVSAVAAWLGLWLARGAAPELMTQAGLLITSGVVSAAVAVNAARERRVEEAVAALHDRNEALESANANQREVSEIAEALLTATRDFTASLEAGEVAARVAHNAWVATQGVAAAILLWDEEREAFRISVVAGGGSSGEVQQLEVGAHALPPLQGAREGVADLPRTSLRDPVLDALLRRWKAAAILAARLHRGDRLLGLLIVARRSAAPASSKACRILSGIALQAAAALESANLVNDLRTASNLKEEFMATMSHELRTPLNVIIGYTEMQREGVFGDLSEEHLDILKRVHEQSLQLLDLIQATLDVGRLERGLMTVDSRDMSVQELIQQLGNAIPPSWRKPTVELSWRVDPAVPRIRSDPAKLQVILRNLVHNALKFTDEGQVSVTVTTDRNRERVHLVVQDSGRGIAAQDLNLIFEMFRQSSDRDPAISGVGLGLYIVKRLVGLLGGEIDVRSAPGRGATFRVHLPVNGPLGSAGIPAVAPPISRVAESAKQ
jgi:signal transduction histidine kinase